MSTQKLTFLVICLLLCLVNSLQDKPSEKDLVLAQVLYRHGDRSPVIGFPKDNFTEEDWMKFGAQGYGQLTWLGMQQQYELGKYFREKYIQNKSSTLLNPDYSRKEIYVRSTDVDRTLMSAYCNLAGMYPPSSSQNTTPWDTGHTIKWQPIPVHTVPQLQDSLLSMDSVCNRSDQLYEKEQQTSAYLNYTTQYKDFFKFLSEKTGMPHENLDNLWITIDALYCEKQHGVPLPAWTKNSTYKWDNKTVSVFDLLMSLQTWEFDLKYGEPAEKAKLRGGPLLKEMIDNMGHRINGTDKDRKFYMYSAHDNTVVALLSALKVYNKLLPQYTATVMVELYQNTSSKEYEVMLQYKNDTAHPSVTYPLIIPGCSLYCPYSKFVNLTADMVPSDWESECQVNPKTSKLNEAMIIGIGVAGGVLLLLCLVGLVYCIRKRSTAGVPKYYDINSAEA